MYTFSLSGRLFIALFIASFTIFASASNFPTVAQQWYVDVSGSDSDDCHTIVTPCSTIDGAIAKAAAGDTILVAEGVYINTDSAVVHLNKNVNLSGGWKNYFSSQGSKSRIDGQSARRGIIISANVITSIERFEIINGLGNSGGGGGGIMILDNSTVSLIDCLIDKVQDYQGISSSYSNLTIERTMIKDAPNAGIFNYLGTLKISSSAVIGNLYGIISLGDTTIENSTISGNTGGGIAMNGGSMSISSTTITQNGDFGLRTTPGATTTLQNTLLAGNTATTDPDCSGPIQSNGYNLIGNTQGCTFSPATGDILNVNSNLGPAQDNGGSTFTNALLTGSPAINAGNPNGCAGNINTLTTDQRGASRRGVCDIGAYEYRGTLVSLSADSNPTGSGQPAVFTAQVIEGDTGTPTGTVAFTYEGGSLGSGALDGTGKASISVSNLPVGDHSITAAYSGDSSFAASTSPVIHHKVGYSTVISITSSGPNPSVVGQPINISFSVSSPHGMPTGVVAVATDIGNHNCHTTLTNGSGSCQIIPTETGAFNVTATYLGYLDFNGSNKTVIHQVNKAETTTLITSDLPDPSYPNSPITVQFTVTANPPGAGTPGGTVTVSTSNGSESCSGLLTGGSGNCQITLHTSGSHILSASYSGDSLFNSSSSMGQTHQVTYLNYAPVALKPCLPVYSDDFSNPASGWPVQDDGKARFEYLNGEYRILDRPTQWYAAARPGFQGSDYAVNVDVRNVTGVNGSYGIAFGISPDWITLYTFEIYSNSNYVIYRKDPTAFNALTGGVSSAINPGAAINQIRVERYGIAINVFANGQFLTSIQDAAYTGLLYAGLFVASYDQKNVDIRFDNFKIYPATCGSLNSKLGFTGDRIPFDLQQPFDTSGLTKVYSQPRH